MGMLHWNVMRYSNARSMCQNLIRDQDLGGYAVLDAR